MFSRLMDDLQGIDQDTNTFFDVFHGAAVRTVDDKVMPLLNAEAVDMEVFPMVNNFDGVNWIDIGEFLNSADARARFRSEVARFLATDKYHGLMVDFEDFPEKAQPGYRALLAELSSDLHAKGMKLYVSVPPHNEDFDYAAVSAAADGVVVMNYDENTPDREAGPVASQEWFTRNLGLAQKAIPRDKLICAIGNYGYDWAQKPKHGSLPPDVKNVNVSVQEAWLAARDSEEDVDFDSDALNPHVSYLDEKNIRHDIWFLDAVTALNQMRAAQTVGIKTFALWRLGSEDRSLWRVWDVPGEANAPDKLRDVPPGQDVDMEGQGEILRIEARPTDGERELKVDARSGLITEQDFNSLPEPYRVARYGRKSETIVSNLR